MLLGQALSGGEAADAQRREAGEILGRATPGAVVKELRILRQRLANLRNRRSALFYLREIDQQTSEICLLLAAQTRPPQCF